MKKIYISPQIELVSIRTEGHIAIVSQELSSDTDHEIPQQTIPVGDEDGAGGFGTPSGAKHNDPWESWDQVGY